MIGNQAVQEWWAKNPMTYGAFHGKAEYVDGTYEIGSREFFERLDRELFNWNHPLHNVQPFDRLFPFGRYGAGARILEIGCGMGTMASLWAQRGAHVTAVDLNPTAVDLTTKRFRLDGLTGTILLQDANSLSFANAAFDYAYSWGVLHHSPNLKQSLAEIMRVLRPGGEFGVMLYNRHSLLHWYMTEYIEGFLHYERRFLGPLELASRYGDGAREEGNPHTWPVTEAEARAILEPHTSEVRVRKLGTELDSVFQLLLPGLGMVLPSWAKKPWARRFGWSLWIEGRKD